MQNLPQSQAAKIAALRRDPYFKALKASVLLDLSQGTVLRQYGPGEIVCWQGEPASGLYRIEKGSVKLFKLSPKGRELIIRVFEAGNSFNEVPVFDHGMNVVNVAALEMSEIWVVDAGLIREKLQENPDMAQAVIHNLAENLRMLVDKVEELSFYQVTTRLARLISKMPAEGYKSSIGQTQDQLAAQLGTVREVVARALRELERSGAIQVNRRQISVVNMNRLRDWLQE
jgi:CRP/FNR family transcriptional regulator